MIWPRVKLNLEVGAGGAWDIEGFRGCVRNRASSAARLRCSESHISGVDACSVSAWFASRKFEFVADLGRVTQPRLVSFFIVTDVKDIQTASANLNILIGLNTMAPSFSVCVTCRSGCRPS